MAEVWCFKWMTVICENVSWDSTQIGHSDEQVHDMDYFEEHKLQHIVLHSHNLYKALYTRLVI